MSKLTRVKRIDDFRAQMSEIFFVERSNREPVQTRGGGDHDVIQQGILFIHHHACHLAKRMTIYGNTFDESSNSSTHASISRALVASCLRVRSIASWSSPSVT